MYEMWYAYMYVKVERKNNKHCDTHMGGGDRRICNSGCGKMVFLYHLKVQIEGAYCKVRSLAGWIKDLMLSIVCLQFM